MILLFIFLIAIGMNLFLVGFRYWQKAVLGVFLWLLVEGAVRKWVLPQYQAPILLIKDFALLAAYCGYINARKEQIPQAEKLTGFAILFAAHAVYCFLEVLNPNLPNVAVAIYGIKNYLMYIPLLYVVPEIIKTREQVSKLLFWAFATSIPLFLLSLYQFSQPPTSWINHYVSHEAGAIEVSYFGSQGEGDFKLGHARAASTFSYLSGYTTYLLLIVPLLAARLLTIRTFNRETMLVPVAFVLSIGGTITTGSRSPMLIFALTAPFMMAVMGAKNILPRYVVLRVIGAGTLLLLAAMFLFPSAVEALLFRAETAGDASSRFTAPFEEIVGAFKSTPVFGMGVGSNSNAVGTLADRSLYWLQGNLFEVEHARVMQDLGIAGFVMVYAIKFYSTYLVAKNLFWSRSKAFVATHMGILAYCVPHAVYLYTVNNPTGGLLYWGVVGLSVALSRIEHRERRVIAAAQSIPPPGARASVAMA